MICGNAERTVPAEITLPDTGDICCEGVALDGPQYCTCWEVVLDAERRELLRVFDVPTPSPAVQMCGDCAFRPGSPEKADDPEVVASSDQLEQCVRTGDPFWCHEGMAKVIGFRHPSGAYIDYPNDWAFQPRMVRADDRATPFRADGRPALLCSGWYLQRRKHLEREAGAIA